MKRTTLRLYCRRYYKLTILSILAVCSPFAWPLDWSTFSPQLAFAASNCGSKAISKLGKRARKSAKLCVSSQASAVSAASKAAKLQDQLTAASTEKQKRKLRSRFKKAQSKATKSKDKALNTCARATDDEKRLQSRMSECNGSTNQAPANNPPAVGPAPQPAAQGTPVSTPTPTPTPSPTPIPNDPRIFGTWEQGGDCSKNYGVGPWRETYTYEFKPDGTYFFGVGGATTCSDYDLLYSAHYYGSYTYDGQTLTITPQFYEDHRNQCGWAVNARDTSGSISTTPLSMPAEVDSEDRTLVVEIMCEALRSYASDILVACCTPNTEYFEKIE